MNTAIIIDDDGLIRRLVTSLLETMDCTVVGVGEDGKDTLPLYREHVPDLLLLDINMPGTNGLDALRNLLDAHPDAYVVMLTGLADTTVAEACMTAGAKDFLHKDAGPQDLRLNLERVLREVRSTLPSPSSAGATTQADYHSTFIDILKQRSSVRSFTDALVPNDLVRTVLNAAQHAPTSSNMQAYSFVVVRDNPTKARLAELAGGQAHVADCPVFIAICADIHRLENAIGMGGGTLAKGHMEMSLVATIDAALVGMSASLVAESLDLGGCMIGGMRNHPEDVARLLNLPDGVFVAFGMTLGYPKDRPPSKPRYPDEGVIHWEKYEEKPLTALNERYNADLEAQKEQTGRADGVQWTERLAKGFSEPKRQNLKTELHNLGFDFD